MSGSGRVRVAVAGSTGTIGVQTLDVVGAQPDRFEITAIGAGGHDVEGLIDQARTTRAKVVAVADPAAAPILRDALAGCDFRAGDGALASLADEADIIVNAVVGFAGLDVTLAALHAGRRLALANKESLIAAGPVVQRARRTPGAELVPVDSEHCALHMCLRANRAPAQVSRLLLTASGGPFRGRPRHELGQVTVRDALAHPTWSMGPKITVDSSTLMNKGLEVIEANELYGRPAGDLGCGVALDQIDVVVHPQSVVHSMVEYRDGAVIAQLSMPDMRLPIGYALAYPDRIDVPFGRMSWSELCRLDFEPPDRAAFPCLDLAYEAAQVGGTAPAWLSAANEVAVDAFLAGRIRWSQIADVVAATIADHDGEPGRDLDDIMAADQRARSLADRCIGKGMA
ncbi:MAG: 1-deoxy-D-xylulose-5-phosphate reductoisomerase [Actinobacteria bacterium]|nr:1-deoxy-D-xylulose-5-phosphate reductoisomerase [Actinomycetota bacterium]